MNFKIEQLEIQGVSLLRGRRFEDERGYFTETWSARDFEALGLELEFVQDNHSLSVASGTVRGLHFQRTPYAQAKLVRVVRGSIYDVAVDVRRHSPTFGHWVGKILKADDDQLLIARGFAHGFLSLEPMTEVAYRVDAPYNPAAEGGIRWDDADLAISWPINRDKAILSPRDAALPWFNTISFD